MSTRINWSSPQWRILSRKTVIQVLFADGDLIALSANEFLKIDPQEVRAVLLLEPTSPPVTGREVTLANRIQDAVEQLEVAGSEVKVEPFKEG